MRRALDGAQLVRLQAYHREARLNKVEAVDVERAGNELRRVAARALDVSVGIGVRSSNRPPYAGIIIDVDRGKGGQSVRQAGDLLDIAAEAVDHDDRALTLSETQKLGLHEHFLKKRRGTFPSPSRCCPQPSRGTSDQNLYLRPTWNSRWSLLSAKLSVRGAGLPPPASHDV